MTAATVPARLGIPGLPTRSTASAPLRTPQTAQEPRSADQDGHSDFPDLLSAMAKADARPESSRPARVLERLANWRQTLAQGVTPEDDQPAGEDAGQAALPAGDAEPTTTIDTQSVTAGPAIPLAGPFAAGAHWAEVSASLPAAQAVAANGTFAPADDVGQRDGATRQPSRAILRSLDVARVADDDAPGWDVAAAVTAATSTGATDAVASEAADATLGRNAQFAPLTHDPRAPAGKAIDRRQVPVSATARQLVSVLGQETHIAPIQSQSPGQHVVARALADVARGAQAASDRSGDGTAASGAARLAAGTADGTEGLKPVEPAERQAGWEDRPHGEDSAAGKEGATPKAAATAAEGTSASVARDGPHAPPAPLGPSQQVASRIVAAAVAAQQAGTAIDASGTKAISAPVVKVLHLELQPADLGTITVRMSLKQDALDIRLEASRHDTAVALQNDQDGLAKLLASAGYRIDGVTIATNAANAAQASDSRAPGSFASSMPGQWDASQSDPRSSGGRQDALPDPRASHGRQNDDTDRSSASRGSSGDLYV